MMRTICIGLAGFWLLAAPSFPAMAQPPAADNLAKPAADNLAGPAADNLAKPAADNQAKPVVYISMDFTDVDLPVLVKFISEQTRKNFIFDEKLQGKITVISPRKISVDEAYNVFLSVLQVKGFTTVEQGNTIKIIPIRDAKQDSLSITKNDGNIPPSEFIIRLIPLRYVDTTEITTLLSPLVSKDGLLSAFQPSNTLILIDSRANIDRIVKILEEIDVEGTSSVLRIYPMKNASVTDVAKTLESLYQESAAGGAPGAAGARRVRPGPGKSRGTAPKFIADTRTNSLIVLAGQDLQADIEDLLKKLDMKAPEHTGKINVYYLENSEAEEVAKVLASLTEKRTPSAPTAPAAGAAAAAAAKGVISAEFEGGVRVTADKATNSLIIIASMNDYTTLLDVIRKLDIRRRQVYVEALIMEISLDKGQELGTEFRGATSTASNGAAMTGTNFGFTGGVNDLFTAIAAGNPLLFSGTGLSLAGTAGTVTLSDGTEIPAITAVLRASQTKDNVNILSTPHLLTLDNKEAEIIVGENVPFITSQAKDTTNLSNVINTIERKDVGITLRLTPHIHESEFVNLEIYQESSAIKSTADSTTVGPTTTKRSAKTSVLVKNGDTVILGGMMRETYTTTESKVPLLGDIPILGYLFKFKSVSKNKTNLLIFLTPHVIKDPKEIERHTVDQRKKMDTFLEENKGELDGAPSRTKGK